MPTSPRLDMQSEPGLRVVRFASSRIYDDAVVREVFEQLSAVVPPNAETALVLDFSNVEMISSSMLGKLIPLQRRVDQQQGKLRLCGMSGTVRSVFRTTNLDRLFKIDRDLAESREALGISS